ncbi:hypothetical protein JT06_00010 [Desulfobulbus sp. Tol-SR]|jgi:hypothetical protein|nr:hypothetical protein JT06_00010 [Desulfobulbus sp. Tol-SR]
MIISTPKRAKISGQLKCLRRLPENSPGSVSWWWPTHGSAIRGSGNRCARNSARRPSCCLVCASTVEIIEYYGARWKIEAGFKELKQDIGSAETQNRNPIAVKNHLNLCMMATSLTRVYACHLDKTPSRRHAVKGRNHFAFSDVRRLIARDALDKDFQ